MRKPHVLLTILLSVVCAVAQNPAPSKSIAGNWLGTIEVQGFKLRLALKVAQAPDGKLTAKLDSLDQAVNAD